MADTLMIGIGTSGYQPTEFGIRVTHLHPVLEAWSAAQRCSCASCMG
jgi:hypothetical protein